jgi:type II secretory pathway component PulF
MPAFTYKARNPRGELLTGRLEGSSSDAVADELMRSGLTPVDVKALVGKVEAASLFGTYLNPQVQ